MFPVPQSREEASAFLTAIGTAQRERDRIEADMNDTIAKLTVEGNAKAEVHKALIEGHTKGLQVWAAANRKVLTEDGKTKTVVLATGEIAWRMYPPKVNFKRGLKVEDIIKTIKALRLKSFLRAKVEINKEAMLADPEKANSIEGVTVGSKGEEFYVKPAETALEEVARG
jgi:phage host-nuclease inhibitor protein Gam